MNGTTQHTMSNEQRMETGSRLLGVFMLTVALSLSGAAAWADGDGHGYGHDPKPHLEKLTKKLDLTKEQQDKILPIIEEKHQKMEGLHQQMTDMRKQAMAKIEAELTPEQQTKWKEMQEEREEKMKEYKEKHGDCDKKGKHDKGEKHE
ncbi:MAG: periplasmic heavy metal sensor [Nitrospirales bacterium]|nr:periplasmic heavy metal sensor [Nitrospirales bacterium]